MRFRQNDTEYAAIQRAGGEPLRVAHREWDKHGAGPRAVAETRRDRDIELEAMLNPGGTLADLDHFTFALAADLDDEFTFAPAVADEYAGVDALSL